jgi:hypothetical protein
MRASSVPYWNVSSGSRASRISALGYDGIFVGLVEWVLVVGGVGSIDLHLAMSAKSAASASSLSAERRALTLLRPAPKSQPGLFLEQSDRQQFAVDRSVPVERPAICARYQ